MRRFVVTTAALVLGAGLCAAEPAAPITIAPAGLGFSAEFPVQPSAKDESVDLGEGKKALMHTFQIMANNAIYDLTVVDYPAGTVQSTGAETILDNARNGAVNNALGPLISETRIEFAGRPARELEIDMTMGMAARSRIFTVGDRMFILGMITRKDQTKSDRVETFFSSFKLKP